MAITKILFRRGTNTARLSTTLFLGEPGYSVDTKRLFIGDGTTPGGTPVGIVNYGTVAALSGSYVYGSTKTNLTSAAFTLLSAANVGDFIYDQTTTSIWTVSSITTINNNTVFPVLSNLVHLYSTTNYNSGQFYYNGTELTIKNGQNGQGYGVGISELNSSVTAGSPTLSGGSGNVLSVKAGSIGNTFITPGNSNSVKITNSTGVVSDVIINQNQLLGRTNAGGSTLGAVTLTATGSLALSANNNTILFSIPYFLPLSGGALTGGVSALSVNNGRLVTDVVPVNPYDVVNLTYANTLVSVTPGYVYSRFLPLTGGTLSGPGNLIVNGISTFGSAVNITGTLSATKLTIAGAISAQNGLSATGIQNFASPINGFDVTNKAYVDSKFIPITGGTFTGRVYNANVPGTSTEIVNKAYVDNLQSFAVSNFLALSGGTLTGSVSSTNRIYVTNTPVASAELANKNYVDTQLTPAGTVSFFAASTPPTGWIKANGAVLQYQNTSTQPPTPTGYYNLWKAIGSTWTLPGDGPNNFRLPDLRGQFIRGWNDGISNGNTTNTNTNPTIPTTDAGRSFGTLQADAFQGHIHSVTQNAVQANNGGVNGVNGSNFGAATITIGNPVADGTNGVPRTGSETRPTNISLLACIKY